MYILSSLIINKSVNTKLLKKILAFAVNMLHLLGEIRLETNRIELQVNGILIIFVFNLFDHIMSGIGGNGLLYDAMEVSSRKSVLK